MKNKKLILLTTAVILITLMGLSSFLTIENSRNCDQFVIDTYELISGIDIPKQTHAQCFYFEKERVRVGIYSLNNTQDFIRKNGLEQLSEDDGEWLWSQQFLMDEDVNLPLSANTLFQIRGDDNGNKWQCLVDRDSGNMWFEVKWKD